MVFIQGNAFEIVGCKMFRPHYVSWTLHCVFALYFSRGYLIPFTTKIPLLHECFRSNHERRRYTDQWQTIPNLNATNHKQRHIIWDVLFTIEVLPPPMKWLLSHLPWTDCCPCQTLPGVAIHWFGLTVAASRYQFSPREARDNPWKTFRPGSLVTKD